MPIASLFGNISNVMGKEFDKIFIKYGIGIGIAWIYLVIIFWTEHSVSGLSTPPSTIMGRLKEPFDKIATYLTSFDKSLLWVKPICREPTNQKLLNIALSWGYLIFTFIILIIGCCLLYSLTNPYILIMIFILKPIIPIGFHFHVFIDKYFGVKSTKPGTKSVTESGPTRLFMIMECLSLAFLMLSLILMGAWRYVLASPLSQQQSDKESQYKIIIVMSLLSLLSASMFSIRDCYGDGDNGNKPSPLKIAASVCYTVTVLCFCTTALGLSCFFYSSHANQLLKSSPIL